MATHTNVCTCTHVHAPQSTHGLHTLSIRCTTAKGARSSAAAVVCGTLALSNTPLPSSCASCRFSSTRLRSRLLHSNQPPQGLNTILVTVRVAASMGGPAGAHLCGGRSGGYSVQGICHTVCRVFVIQGMLHRECIHTFIHTSPPHYLSTSHAHSAAVVALCARQLLINRAPRGSPATAYRSFP